MSVKGDKTIFRLDYDYMRVAMQLEYERTGNPMFIRWIDSQDKYIADHGLDSDEVQKNLYLKWIVEVGNFISLEHLMLHRRTRDNFSTRLADLGLDFAKGENGDETIATLMDYERNIRTWAVFKGDYTDQVDEIATWLPQQQAVHNVSVRFVICDTTGVGDPVRSMLKRKLRTPVRGVVFTVQHKDVMAKKLQKAFSAKNDRERLTYPANHPLTQHFEKQFKNLLKERRATGQLNLTHGTGKYDHDDYPQSCALSLWKYADKKNRKRININRDEGSTGTKAH